MVIGEKLKYIQTSRKQPAHFRLGTQANIESCNFEIEEEFIYLEPPLKSNETSMQLGSKISTQWISTTVYKFLNDAHPIVWNTK